MMIYCARDTHTASAVADIYMYPIALTRISATALKWGGDIRMVAWLDIH